jgi:hypothetical protein
MVNNESDRLFTWRELQIMMRKFNGQLKWLKVPEFPDAK